jgi:hypothetical protein
MALTVIARRAASALLAATILASTHVALGFDFDDVAALARRKAVRTPDGAQPVELKR